MQQEQIKTSLPENAYRELKAGEEYQPVMGAQMQPREVTPYSVTLGLVMAVIFSAAAAYLGLKVGQVFEAAIPIAIIAVGIGQMRGKKNCWVRMSSSSLLVLRRVLSLRALSSRSPRSTSSVSRLTSTRCSSHHCSAVSWASAL